MTAPTNQPDLQEIVPTNRSDLREIVPTNPTLWSSRDLPHKPCWFCRDLPHKPCWSPRDRPHKPCWGPRDRPQRPFCRERPQRPFWRDRPQSPLWPSTDLPQRPCDWLSSRSRSVLLPHKCWCIFDGINDFFHKGTGWLLATLTTFCSCRRSPKSWDSIVPLFWAEILAVSRFSFLSEGRAPHTARARKKKNSATRRMVITCQRNTS